MKWVGSAQALRLALVSPLILISSSCGGPKRLPVYPVKGEVSFMGKSAPGALVVFHPVGNEHPQAPQPSGYVQADGSFLLTTYAPDDGAREGEYRVVICWNDPNAQPDRTTGEVPNRLPSRYANTATSGLHAKVEQGSENRANFRLGK